jgi:hypothetical protein
MQTRVLRSSSAALLPLLVFTLVLAGCGGESTTSTEVAAGDSAAARSGTSSGFRCLRRHRHCKPTTTTNTPPTISGVPATTVNADSGYDFMPVARDAESDALSFRIQNMPAWANFSAADGHLSGTPDAADAGTYSGIVISVTDGKAAVSLPAFAIEVMAPDTGGGTPGGGTTGGAAPTISGTPATTVTVGSAYSFAPQSSGPSGTALIFSISGKPSWVGFSTTTGALSGTPTAADVGTSAPIVISVSAGSSSAALAAFTITVNAAAGTGTGSTVPPAAACSSALTGTHATYNVGPGKTYAELTDVPWLSLQAGDVVNIHYRATPYKTYVALKAMATAASPVIINGVTDSPTAPCKRPEVSGSGAVYAADRAGYDNTGQYSTQNGAVFMIWWGQGGWARIPKYITIQNLKITGGTSGIYAVTVEDLLVQNCEITANNGWGVFVNTKNDDANGEETSKRITIRANSLHGNGVVGSYLYHNLYVQARRALYEGNFVGQLIPGAVGSSLKDRSSGTVIRYNTIVAAARAIDLVETEGGHGTNGNPNQVDTDPLYHDAWIYGNLIINDGTLSGANSGRLIHWGYDNTFERARTGTLYFYNNTVLSHDSSGTISLFDQQSNNDSRDPGNTVELRNNIIWQTGGAKLAMTRDIGTVSFVGGNWVSSGWAAGPSGNTVQVTGAPTLSGTDPKLNCSIPATAAMNCTPAAGSPVIGAGSGTTATPVSYTFAGAAELPAAAVPGVVARGSANDLGAFGQ